MSWESASSPSVAALRALAAPDSPVSTPHLHEDTKTRQRTGQRKRGAAHAPTRPAPPRGVDGRAARLRRAPPFSRGAGRGHGRSSGDGQGQRRARHGGRPTGEEARTAGDRRAGGDTENQRGRAASGRGGESELYLVPP